MTRYDAAAAIATGPLRTACPAGLVTPSHWQPRSRSPSQPPAASLALSHCAAAGLSDSDSSHVNVTVTPESESLPGHSGLTRLSGTAGTVTVRLRVC